MFASLQFAQGLLRAVLPRSSDSCLVQANFTFYSQNVPVETFAPFDAYQANIFRFRQQQSVNLGSWFVQESWMNPGLFLCAAGKQEAEIDVAGGWGGILNARSVLEQHWDQWIVEDDFKYLASIGINTVRLPLGYWSLGPEYCLDTPFESVAEVYTNSWPRVVRAVNWAAKYNLGVLIDLHGAPGQAHSGISDGVQSLFENQQYMDLTINVLTNLANQFVNVTNIVGIELLNEPSLVPGLEEFLSATNGSSLKVSIQDGYNLQRFADYVSNRTDFLVVDHHSYFIFGNEASLLIPASAIVVSLTEGTVATELLQAAETTRGNLVVNEFSCALSPQALVGNATQLQETFCSMQVAAYANMSAGWSFWRNCEQDSNWCFRDVVGSILPSDFNSYPNLQEAVNVPNQIELEWPISPLIVQNSFLVLRMNADVGLDYGLGRDTALMFASFDGSRLGFVKEYYQRISANSRRDTTDDEFDRFALGLADAELDILDSML